MAEQALLRLHTPGSFEVVILRPSMFYGPPVPDRHIDVYRRIRDGRFPVIGNGKYSRSITYIDHLVQAVMLASVKPQASGQTYYVVDDKVYTTLEICEAMASALGVSLRRLWLPSAIGPIAYWTDQMLAATGFYWQTLHLVGESDWHVGISCDKLRRELGYRPTVTLEEGMRRAVQWCRCNGKL
jgi:nucleoside-diphosphate-sugar epimerase